MRESELGFAPEEVKREWEEIYGRIEAVAKGMREEDWSHFTPQFLGTKSDETTPNQVSEALAKAQGLALAETISQQEAIVKIDTALPITPFFVADIHLGNIYTNHALWDAHRRYILETPGVYVVFLGNLVDNAIPAKFPDGMLANALHPHRQFETMQAQIKELDQAGKILAALDEGSCHEGWSWQKAGISATKLLYGYEGRNFPVLSNGGILDLTVGQETYRIGLWHKQGPFNSNFNKSHSLLQNRRLGNRNTDIEAGAHHHNSEALNTWVGYLQQMTRAGFIRVGTYKGYWPDGDGLPDRFVVDRWGKSGEPPGNSAILYPFSHDLETTLGFEAGLRKHEAIRIALWLETVGEKQRLLEVISHQGLEA